MTLQQYSAAVDAWVWIDQQIHMYGPGLALTAACIAISWTCSKVRAWRERRRDTQPGADDDLLTACWDAWRANNTDTRTEDQP